VHVFFKFLSSVHVQIWFQFKNPDTSHWEIILLYYPGNTLLSNFHPMICEVVAYVRFKTKQKFPTFSSRSGCGHLHCTRGGCLQEVPNTVIWMVFWKTGHWGEVVAYERWWLQVEGRLCCTILVAQVITSSLLICIIKKRQHL